MSRPDDPHAGQPVRLLEPTAGVVETTRALLLLHGRGATANGIVELGHELARALGDEDLVLMAPQAQNDSWYPRSFLEPLARNQPWLDSALRIVEQCTTRLADLGIPSARQVLVGFSQGACLASESVARSPRRYGGLVAFTGGILGPLDEGRAFAGSLEGTRVFLSTGDPDPHVPVRRVEETARLFEGMSAAVQLEVHPGRPHTILPREVESAGRWLVEPVPSGAR